jgi:hypothetical protein
MVEVMSVAIKPAVWPPGTPAALTALQTALQDACGRVLAQANANTKPKASTDAAGYTLTGIPAVNQPPPPTPGFPTSDADLTALLRAQDPVIAAKLFQGISGAVSAVVDGTLTLVTLTVTRPLPRLRDALEEQVVIALNIALDKAKRLFEDGIKKRVETGSVDPGAVTFQTTCLYAHGTLALADRVKVKRQDGTFAPVVNAGTVETNVGVEVQVGDVWSRAPVVLRERAHVNGSLRTMRTLTRQNATVVTGTITENGPLLQIPTLSLAVTFPTTNQGAVSLEPNTTKTIAPGAFADVSVKSGATLSLSAGTYFFNNWTVEPQAKISCTSTSGQVVVHVKNGFTFRGSIVEKTGGRPKVFVGVFGTGAVSLGAPFPGTVVALNASLDLATVGSPGHSGAFFAKNITVQPDNTITYFPFVGPPTIG